MNEYEIGTVLTPFAGGGDFGKCRRCHREGLRIVRIPEPQPKKPIGWTKIPEE